MILYILCTGYDRDPDFYERLYFIHYKNVVKYVCESRKETFIDNEDFITDYDVNDGDDFELIDVETEDEIDERGNVK